MSRKDLDIDQINRSIHGQLNWQRRLMFRDALRADQGLASRYESLKQNLAERHSEDREAYTAEKANFINSIVGV